MDRRAHLLAPWSRGIVRPQAPRRNRPPPPYRGCLFAPVCEGSFLAGDNCRVTALAMANKPPVDFTALAAALDNA